MTEVTVTLDPGTMNEALFNAGYAEGVQQERSRIVLLFRHWATAAHCWPMGVERTYAGVLEFLASVFDRE